MNHDNWTPPPWPEYLRIAFALIVVGGILFLVSFGTVSDGDYAGHQFIPFVGDCFLLFLGILVWLLIPISIYKRLRWKSRNRMN